MRERIGRHHLDSHACAFDRTQKAAGTVGTRRLIGIEWKQIVVVQRDTPRAQLTELEAAAEVTRGIDTVIHLAATPDNQATWAELVPANITTTYNILVAAAANGCRRVILASSIHAVTGYPHDVQVRTDDPVNPG